MQWFLWIIAVIASAGAGYWVYRADVKRAVPYPWITSLLRAVVVFLTLLLLLAPVISISRNETQKPVILFLQDNSRSVAENLGKDSALFRSNSEDLLQRLSDKYKVVKWGFGNGVQPDSLFSYKQQATDISTALGRAQEYYGLQNLGAIILPTDGRFNQGTHPLYQQLSLNGTLYTVAIGDSIAQKDLRIAQVYHNKVVSLNSQFEVRADIVASLCNGYSNSVQLTEAGNLAGSAPITVSSDRYDRSVSFSVRADRPGLHHYVIQAPVMDGEKNVTNNRRDVFVEVVDQKKNVLIAAAAPHPDLNAIKEALSGLESFKVTVKMADELPASLSDYQVIILHQLPGQYREVLQKVTAAKKPVWCIVGAQPNVNTANEVQSAVTIRQPGVARDVFAGYNSSFNIFTLPASTQAVLDKMPPLFTATGNIDVSPSAHVLLNQRINTSNTSAPLWALQQGSTPSAILAGEGLWRWRLYEYRHFNQHLVVDELIRQTVSFLSVNANERPFQVELPKYIWSDQEAVTINAYLLNANNEQVNTPEAKITLSDSAGKKYNYTLERSGTAYKLNTGILAGGSYSYSAQVTYNGKPYTATGSFVVESMPLELMETGADHALLYSLARKYNGSMVPVRNISNLYDSLLNNQNIKPLIQTETETAPLVNWKWFFFLILLLAAAEWLLRKYWMAQ
ncbi:MAG: hypothetical protein JNL72_01005 [Flavipsychrobacter sp.]|nr:hypothetical protein [Flavipsychrobacter sp.]